MKKLFSTLLVLAMLLSLVGLMPTASAAADPAYKMMLVGTTLAGNDLSEFGFDASVKKALQFELKITAPQLYTNMTCAINFNFDKTKLQLIDAGENYGQLITFSNGPKVNADGACSIGSSATVKQGTNQVPIGTINTYGGNTSDGTRTQILFAFTPTRNITQTNGAEYTVATFFFNQLVDDDKLDQNTLTLTEGNDFIQNYGEDYVAKITKSSASDLITYGTITYTGADRTGLNYDADTLAKPTITYPNSDKTGPAPDLQSVSVTLDKNTAAISGTQKSVVITATAAPNPTGAALGDLTWSVSPTTGVTVQNTKGATCTFTVGTGVATSATTYTVTATPATGTAGTATFSASKDAAVATTIELNKTAAQLGDLKVPAVGQQGKYSIAATVKDQYGTTMTGQTVSVSGDSAITYNGTQLLVADTVTVADNVTLTFTCGSATATLKVNVKKGDGPAAPAGLTATDAATKGGKGTLNSTTADMEYNTNRTASTGWVTCTAGSTEVAKGSYYVRYKATTKYNAGTATTDALVVGEPGTSATPTVTVTPAGPVELAENGSQVLTAAVSGTNVTEANCTFQWQKGSTDIPSATSKTLTVTEAGEYKCVVTHTAGANDPAQGTSNVVTVTVKSKTTVKVEKKTAASQYEGALNLEGLVTVKDGTWDQVKNAVTATVYKYTPAVEADEENEVEAAAAKYDEVTGNLTEGTYYVDVAVAAITNQESYKVDAVAGLGKPDASKAPNELTGYVVLTVNEPATITPGVVPSGYTVTYAAGEHGTLTGAAKETVSRGGKPANVPAVQAKAGYRFVGWSSDGVTIVDPTTVSITASTTFTAMYELATDPYISGDGNGNFRPNSTATRAELATMLARLSKDFDPEANYDVATSDMSASAWYLPYMKYAIHAGIMSGYEDGSYKPTAEITRGEFAKMLACYLGLNLDSDVSFPDANGWAAPYINALKKAGIVRGYEDGTFRQNNKLTRAEAVTMINKAVELSYKAGTTYEKSFTDVSINHWAYSDIIAAANTPASELMK